MNNPGEQGEEEEDGSHPPEPTNAAGAEAGFGAELVFDESVIVKVVIRQAKPLGVRFFRPATPLIGATFRTRPRIGRNLSAANRAEFRRHSGAARWPRRCG